MARRKRKSDTSGLAAAAVVFGGAAWLWSQWWGQLLLVIVGIVVLAAGISYVARAPGRRRERLMRLATMQGLLELTPSQFEHEVAALLRSRGFSSVRVSGGAGDLQADITATDPAGLATVVQCKRYAPGRTIGSPVIQSFVGMARIHHGCDRALFVTTGSFTGPARQLAEKHDIELLDGFGLVELFTERIAIPA